MSLAIACDKCGQSTRTVYVTDPFDDLEVLKNWALKKGWTEHEFGDACPNCSNEIKELNEMDDPRETITPTVPTEEQDES